MTLVNQEAPAHADEVEIEAVVIAPADGATISGPEVAPVGDEGPIDEPTDVTPDEPETDAPGNEDIPGVTDQPDADVIDPPDDQEEVESDVDETEVPEGGASSALPVENRDDTPPQTDDEVDDPSSLFDIAGTFKTPLMESAALERRAELNPKCSTQQGPGLPPVGTPPVATRGHFCIREASASEIERSAASFEAFRAEQSLISSAGPAASSVVELPSFCFSSKNKWRYTRYEACKYRMNTAYLYYEDRMGLHFRGALTYAEINHSKMSPTSKRWLHHVVLSLGAVSGDVAGVNVQNVSFKCSNSCSTNWTSEYRAFGTVGSVARWDSQWVDAKLAKGKRRSMTATTGYKFTRWDTIPSDEILAGSRNTRCDQSLKGSTTVGCVVPSKTPVMLYSRSGAYPQLARHIQAAQKSGLPGAYGKGKPLTRLTDDYKIGRNRDRSCPKALKKKYKTRGKSCDEYPFASSFQGPYTAKTTNPRVFGWCIFPKDLDTGSKGFSRCMIHAKQNSQGGNQLGIFYGAYGGNRLLSGDAYRVKITA